MKTARRYWFLHMGLVFLVVWLTGVANAQDTGNSQKIFKAEQLQQMLAPVALYPDALLSQILMACTYPSNVADAAAWSKANSKLQGDAAVNAVANQPWDPSVQSLVAFPEVLAQMAQQPEWVQNVGDAFLAQPDDVMSSIQALRAEANKAGNLKSNEQQKVVVQQASAGTTVIQIEPANPEVVYVPTYNPTVVYGVWAYPGYPPPYWPPPPGYYHPVATGLAAGIAFGVGIAVVNSLWGGFDWHHNNVNINVNRYNHINVNHRISGNGNVNWNHNPQYRRGTPYRDNQSRQRYDKGIGGANNRTGYRGRSPQANASRANALNSFNSHTNNGAAANLRNGTGGRGGGNLAGRTGSAAGNAAGGRSPGGGNARGGQRPSPRAGGNAGARNNAFSGVRSPGTARAQSSRGNTSLGSMNSSRSSRGAGARTAGHQVSRPVPARGGTRRH